MAPATAGETVPAKIVLDLLDDFSVCSNCIWVNIKTELTLVDDLYVGSNLSLVICCAIMGANVVSWKMNLDLLFLSFGHDVWKVLAPSSDHNSLALDVE